MLLDFKCSLFIIFYLFCTAESSTHAVCPEGFSSNNRGCYQILVNRTFEDGCEFRDTAPFMKKELENQSEIWLPAKYDTKKGFFVWIDKSKWYGMPLRTDAVSWEGECLTNRNISKNCASTSSHYCSYELMNTACDQYEKICDNESSDKCFCQSNLLKDHFCYYYYCSDRKGSSGCSNCEKKFEEYGEPSIELHLNDNNGYVVINQHLKFKRMGTEALPFSCLYDSKISDGLIMENTTNGTNSYLLFENWRRQVYEIQFPNYPLGQKIWCFGFVYPQLELIQTNSVHSSRGVTFITQFPVNFSTQSPTPITNLLNKNFSDKLVNSSNHFDTFSIQTNCLAKELCLVNQFFVTEHFGELKNALNNLTNIFPNISIFPYSNCLEEDVELFNKTVRWQTAELGQIIPPEAICLDKDGKLVTRICLSGATGGTTWFPKSNDIDCSLYRLKETTRRFFTLYKQEFNTHKQNQYLFELLKNETEVLPEDVYFVSKIIEKIIRNEYSFSISSMLSSINHLMYMNEETLRASQKLYNSTDRIIYSLEEVISSVSEHSRGYDFSLSLDNLFIQIIDLSNKYISGIAVYSNKIVLIKVGTNLENLTTKDLLFGVQFPDSILNEVLEKCTANFINLIVAISKNRRFFLGTTGDNKLISWAVHIFVPGFDLPFYDAPIKILLKPFRKYKSSSECVFWHYGFDNERRALQGSWKNSPNLLVTTTHEDLYICHSWIMGRFGLLLTDPPSYSLELSLLISTIISFLCLIYFFISAVWIENWIKQVGVKILLSYVATVFLRTLLFCIEDITDSYEQEMACFIIAISIHFIFISQATWLSIVNYFIYRHTILKRGSLSRNFYANSLLIGWLIPILPVVITFVVQPYAYIRHEFCMITGDEFFFSFISVGSVAIFANLYIFGRTIYQVIFSGEGSAVNLHWGVRMGILLFIVFETSWISNLLHGFKQDTSFVIFNCFSVLLEIVLLLVLLKLTKSKLEENENEKSTGNIK